MRVMSLIGNKYAMINNNMNLKKLLVNSTISTQFFIIIALIGSVLGFYYYGINSQSLGLSLFGYFLYGCLGIAVTFHRQLTHNSYNTYGIISKIGTFFGCMANTGSSISWTAIHVNHHLKSDKLGDPHSPWISGWKVFLLDYPSDTKVIWRIRKLVYDPYHQVLHNYYNLILISYSLLLYLLGGFYLMLFLHWVPIVIVAIMSNMVNYAGHKESWWGSYRTYNLNDHSCNNWIWALPSWGEGWHNNHHRYPKSYTTQQKWWEFDVSGMIIKWIKV